MPEFPPLTRADVAPQGYLSECAAACGGLTYTLNVCTDCAETLPAPTPITLPTVRRRRNHVAL